MKVADSVMMLGVFDGVLMASTLYQITLSYAGSAHKLRFSFAFMSPDPIPADTPSPHFDLSSKTWTRKVGLVVLDGLFEGHRGLEAQGAVEAHGVVEGFDVVEDHGAGLASSGWDGGAEAFGW